MSKILSNKSPHQEKFFDKFTGEKYVYVSDFYKNGIKHYRLISDNSGEPALLSKKGLENRFESSPVAGMYNLKTLYKKLKIRA